MNKSIKKIISLALCGILLLTGCKEREDTSFAGDVKETEFGSKNSFPVISETTVPVITTSTVSSDTTTVSDTTAKTTAPETTTTPVTTMVTTTPSPDGGWGNVYTDENGEVLLALTDGIDYVDWVGYYHGYFKLTNVSDKTVTEVREKLESFSAFAEVEEMRIEYPFGDNCVDMIDWENGKPDLENMKKYFEVFYQADYTYDNTLDPEEYCIISVTFKNGTEITTGTTTKPETRVPIHKTFTGKWETVIVDDDGNPMLQLTDGIDYVEMVGYYHGYYKLTNIYDKPVEDIREKLEWFEVFYETDWMMIEYPFNDSCVDTIDWSDGKPDLENISQTTYDMKKDGYTFDNILDPGEYCIIYAVFVNGEEITTTTAEKPEETPAPETTTVPKTTTAPETTTKKTTVTTTVPEDEKPLNTTEKPLSDISYSKFMPKDSILKEAAEIAAKDKEVIIAVYEDGSYKVMTYDEALDLLIVQQFSDLLTRETYDEQVEMMNKYPELYSGTEYEEYYSSYEAFVSEMLKNLEDFDPKYRKCFDDNGNALVDLDPFFTVDLSFEGSDGKVKAEKVAETALRWAFSLRAEENGLEDIINKYFSSERGYPETLSVKCTYDGGDTATVSASNSTYSYEKEVLLTF